jgi:cathepsin D
VQFDTGSSDLFVPSKSCGSSCRAHKKYNPSASSTSQNLGKSFTLVYGGGANATGEQYTDVVTIAGLAVRGAMFFLSFPTKRLHIST